MKRGMVLGVGLLAGFVLLVWCSEGMRGSWSGERKCPIDMRYSQSADAWDNRAWAAVLLATEHEFGENDLRAIAAGLPYSETPAVERLCPIMGVWSASDKESTEYFPQLRGYDAETDSILWSYGLKPLAAVDRYGHSVEVTAMETEGVVWYCKIPRRLVLKAERFDLDGPYSQPTKSPQGASALGQPGTGFTD